jgi:hypothetical protein
VNFTDNGTTVNNAVLNAEGDAEFNGPYYVGSHAVTATYAGDSSYAKSSGSTISFTVAKDTPAIELAASLISQAGQLASGQADVFTIVLLNSANIVSLSNGSITTSTGYPFTVPVAPPTGTVTIGGISGVTSATLAAGVDPQTGAPAGIATITIPAASAAAFLPPPR